MSSNFQPRFQDGLGSPVSPNGGLLTNSSTHGEKARPQRLTAISGEALEFSNLMSSPSQNPKGLLQQPSDVPTLKNIGREAIKHKHPLPSGQTSLCPGRWQDTTQQMSLGYVPVLQSPTRELRYQSPQSFCNTCTGFPQ